LDCEITESYLEFFSAKSSLKVKETLFEYHKIRSSFESFNELNKTLEKIYSDLKKKI